MSTITPIDGSAYVRGLGERFGIPADAFDAFRWVRIGDANVALLPRDAALPEGVDPGSAGLVVLRIHGRYPKLTTEGAMQLGPLATRNVVALDAGRATRFLAHETVEITPAEGAALTAGHVLVRLEELTLGVGSYRPDDGHVLSFFPKHFAGIHSGTVDVEVPDA